MGQEREGWDCWSVQFSSVAQLCLTLCNPMNHSMPGLPVHHQLPESTQTHVHWVDDAIQPSHPLSSPSPGDRSLFCLSPRSWGALRGEGPLSAALWCPNSPGLEKAMAPHSSTLAWRIPGTGEPGGLPSLGSHRVGHDWSDLAAIAPGRGAELLPSCL